MGVFKEVEPNPVNVSMNAFPCPPRNVTEFVPLPLQPAHVNVPEVENVTGSAFAIDVANVTITITTKLIRVAFNIPAIILLLFLRKIPSHDPQELILEL